jgi:hypothetical protein
LGTTKRELVAAPLSVMRKTSFGIELRRGVFEIVLDGTSVAAIDPGRHVLKIRSGRYSSHDRTFDVAGGEVAAFRRQARLGDRTHP